MGKPGKPPKFDDDRRSLFLSKLEHNHYGNLTHAAAAVGVSYDTVNYWRNKDPDFEAAVQAVFSRIDDMLMAQVKFLAIDGVDEPIFDKAGNQIGTRTRYSESMLKAWLKRRESGSWFDKVGVKVEGKVDHQHTHRIERDSLTKEQRTHARRFLQTQDSTPSDN